MIDRRRFIELIGVCASAVLSPFKSNKPTPDDGYDHWLLQRPKEPLPKVEDLSDILCTPPIRVVDYSSLRLNRRMVYADNLDPYFVARAFIIDGNMLLVASYKMDETATRMNDGKPVLVADQFVYQTFQSWRVDILDAEGQSIGVIVPSSLPEGMKLPTTEWHPDGSRILETADALASLACQ